MYTNLFEDYIIVQDVNKYILIDEESYFWILSNIKCNYLMIIFTMTCVCTLVCSYKKPKNDYVLVQNAKPVKGAIVEKV